MVKTKVFKSNLSQVVRLSKVVAFPESVRDVKIVVVGNSRLDSPSASDDFMIDREQPVMQERE
jgi:antitoxin VapB